MKSPVVREKSIIFDYDERFKAKAEKLGGGYTFYDFNDPDGISEKCHHAFDFVVIDPPFITEEVWGKVGLDLPLVCEKCEITDERRSEVTRIYDR